MGRVGATTHVCVYVFVYSYLLVRLEINPSHHDASTNGPHKKVKWQTRGIRLQSECHYHGDLLWVAIVIWPQLKSYKIKIELKVVSTKRYNSMTTQFLDILRESIKAKGFEKLHCPALTNA